MTGSFAIKRSRHGRSRSRIAGLAAGVCLQILASLSWSSQALALIETCVGSGGSALCSAGSASCHIAAPADIAPGSVLNCEGIDLSIEGPSGRLRVTGGSFALRAKSLRIDSGRNITVEPDDLVQTGIEVQLEESLILEGKVTSRSGLGGSQVSIVAGGEIDIIAGNPAIDVRGIGEGADGGGLALK
jgi:hypothetical protein